MEKMGATPEKPKGPQFFEQLDGRRWILDEQGNKAPFTDEQEAEFERQATEYMNGGNPEPVPGMPKFPRTLRFQEMNSSADDSTEQKVEEGDTAKQAGTKAVEDALRNDAPTNPTPEQAPRQETPPQRMGAIMRGPDFFIIGEDGRENKANDAQAEAIGSQWNARAEGREAKPGSDGILYDLTVEPAPGMGRAGSPGNEPPQGPLPGSEYQPSPHQYEAVEGKAFVLDKSKYLGLTIPTMDEIQGKPEMQQLFGELLDGLRPDRNDLLGRMKETGQMSEEESKFIQYCQYEFARRLKEGQDAQSRISPELIREMARRDPELDRIVDLRGPDTLAKVFKQRMLHLAMRNEFGFEQFAHSLHTLQENRETGRFKRYQGEIENLCKYAGIKPHEYDDLFHSPDARDRIRENLRQDMTKGRRTIDSIFSKVGLGSAGRARHAAVQAMALDVRGDRRWYSPQSWVLDDVKKDLEKVAAYAGHTLADAENNPEIIETLTRGAFTGEEVKSAEETGPQSRTEADAVLKDTYSEAAVQSRRNSFRQSYRSPYTDHDWEHMTSEEKSSADNTFQADEIRSATRGKGLWAQIFAYMMQSLLARRMNDIQKKEAAV